MVVFDRYGLVSQFDCTDIDIDIIDIHLKCNFGRWLDVKMFVGEPQGAATVARGAAVDLVAWRLFCMLLRVRLMACWIHLSHGLTPKCHHMVRFARF